MPGSRPFVISIAGLDPCGGAGLLSDIKTFENCLTYGLGVCSSITFQNENTFTGLKWIEKKDIISQLDSLTSLYPIEFAKIGLIENLPLLSELVNYLTNRKIKVIWDPILKTGTGYKFHHSFIKTELKSILSKIYLLTPNLEEIRIIIEGDTITPEKIQEIIKKDNLCSILLKGGHAKQKNIDDILIEADSITVFKGEKYEAYQKHGTGCVLSAAITAYLSLGDTLDNACKKAKEYIHGFILSNEGVLGYHK